MTKVLITGAGSYVGESVRRYIFEESLREWLLAFNLREFVCVFVGNNITLRKVLA